MIDPLRFHSAPDHFSVCVVIPTYNESENLGPLLTRLLALDDFIHVLVVDDNSPDGTGQLANEIAARHPERIRVIHRPDKQGIGPAYLAGFNVALDGGHKLIAQMDADLSHEPEDLPRLLDRIQHADLVLGSRYVDGGRTDGWPFYRRAISRFGGLYARAILGVPINDLTGGFKIYRRETLAGIGLEHVQSDGYVFQIETTYRAIKRGYTVVEEPITFTDRIAGKSKLSRRIVVEAVLTVWRLRFDRSPWRVGGEPLSER